MQAFISLGSNIGDRQAYIDKAVMMLGAAIKQMSPIVETDPVGMDTKEKFLNAVVELDTDLQPFELLDLLESIEKKLGRIDKGNYKPRTIDLDILYYEDIKIDSQRLKIPHPKLKERDFLCTLLTALKKEKAKKK
jgi:2-amino-4-hydroxy-6-hydroxymethyldihydropteridine diphosphokinase